MTSRFDPIGPLLDQIAQLLKFAEEHAGKKLNLNDPTIKVRLEIIQKLFSSFDEITQKALREKGIDPQDITRKIAQHPDQFNRDDQRLLRQSMQLGIDAMIMQSALQSAQAIGTYGKAFTRELLEKKVSKKTVKSRQKKFKRMGGDSNWVPL